MFCCRELLFSKLLYRHQQQQPPPASSCRRQTLSKKAVFPGFQTTSAAAAAATSLRAWAKTCSKPWFFAAGSCRQVLFSKIFLQACRQQNLCCFSRFPDDTLGSFFAWFWTLLVLQSHGVLLPGAAFFEAVLPASAAAAAATSSASSRRQQNLSTNAVFLGFPDDTLGSFFAWFWTLLVLPSHGVLLPGAAFFEAVLPASAAAAAATSSASSRRQQNLSTLLVLQNLLFSKLFYRHQQQQPQATESLDKCCFSRFF